MTDDDKALEFKHAHITGQVMRDHWGPIVDRIADETADPRDALISELIDENERLREALRSAIRNIENLTYDIKCHTECAECQSNVAMYEHAVEEYRAALGETE